MRKPKPQWAAGCMSGTSLDGVDVAVLLTDGETIFEFGPTAYRPYSDVERDVLRSFLGAWPGADGLDRAIQIVENAHLEVLSSFDTVDVIGFHGQTFAHDPQNKKTHQAGDGARLARELGVPVVWDFRTNDVELGGQGAPLAPIYHYALGQHAGRKAPFAVLNLGGVGNVTYVDPTKDAASGMLAFDTGPANAPLDDFILKRTGNRFDEGGKIASAGETNRDVIDRFLGHPFFQEMPPKSLDRDAFSYLATAVAPLSDKDGAATLTDCIAASVAQAFPHFPAAIDQIWITGGGRKNPAIMAALSRNLQAEVLSIDDFGFDGDMLEAQAFAHLAMRVLRGLPTSFPNTTGVPMSVGGGIVSR